MIFFSNSYILNVTKSAKLEFNSVITVYGICKKFL